MSSNLKCGASPNFSPFLVGLLDWHAGLEGLDGDSELTGEDDHRVPVIGGGNHILGLEYCVLYLLECNRMSAD